jgi:hypothetical protein
LTLASRKRTGGRLPGERLSPFFHKIWLGSLHPETLSFPSPAEAGRVRVGVIRIGKLGSFFFHPPIPAPLPRGERELPDET